MRFPVLARIALYVLVAVLVQGPVGCLAAPIAGDVAGMSGGGAASFGTHHAAKAACADCSAPDQGTDRGAASCHAACPLPAALPAVASVERPAAAIWVTVAVAEHPGIAGAVDPRPPKLLPRT